MAENIYGVDPAKNLTPLIVRDALVECFRQAHCADAGIDIIDGDTNKMYCQEIVRKAFTDAGFNFDTPSKEGILKAMDNLAEFAKKFRDQSIVQKHYSEIMKLINNLN